MRIPAESITDSGASRTPIPSKPITRSAATRGWGYFFDFSVVVKPAWALRSDSPRSVSRCAPWTSRSQIASPTVASPMTACQSAGSS